MNIRPDMLRAFCFTAKSGNLIDAANTLCRTTSAVSMSLKQLETEIGGKLFQGERKKQLTPLGKQIFEIAQKQLKSYDEALQSMCTLAEKPEGILRMAAIPSVAFQIFDKSIIEMQQRHPFLSFELRDTDTQHILELLTQSKIDIGITSGFHMINNVKSRLLFNDRFGLVCSINNPIQYKKITPDEIIKAGLISNNLTQIINNKEFLQIEKKACVKAHNTFTLISMLSNTNYVSILPKSVAQIFSDKLIFLNISEITEYREVMLYVRENTIFDEYLTEMVDLIIDYTKGE